MVVLGTLVLSSPSSTALLVALGAARPSRGCSSSTHWWPPSSSSSCSSRCAPGSRADQPLDVPGEVRAVARGSRCCARARQRHRHARCWCRACWGRWRSRAGSPTPRSTSSTPTASGFDLAGHVGPRPASALRRRRAAARSSSGCAARGVIAHGGHRARADGAPHRRRPRSRRACDAMPRALDEMNGSVALALSSEEQLLGAAGHPRRAPARGLLVRRDRALPRGGGQIGDHAAELAGLRAHEGARPPGGAGADGGRSGARDPQPARGDQGRGAVPAASGSAASGARTATRETREFLDIIVEEVNRLNRVVSQFLDYARPYRGEQRPLDVDDVVRKTAAAARPRRREEHGKVEIVTDFADEMPPVRADAEQLLQVFLNLVAQRGAGDAAGRASWRSRPACAARRGAARPAPSSRSAFATPAWASRPATSRTCSSRSSPPRRRGPGWACRSASASSRTTAAPSRSARSRARGDVHRVAADRGGRLRRVPRVDPAGATTRESRPPRGRRRCRRRVLRPAPAAAGRVPPPPRRTPLARRRIGVNCAPRDRLILRSRNGCSSPTTRSTCVGCWRQSCAARGTRWSPRPTASRRSAA